MGEAVIAAPRRGGGAALKLTGAAAMAAVAVYLLNPALVDLGLYIDGHRYDLLAYALIYAAGLIAVAATVGEIKTGNLIGDVVLSLVVGAMALLALGVIFGALAVNAVFRDEPNLWVGLLALPAALCLYAVWTERPPSGTKASQAFDKKWNVGRAIAGYAWFALYFTVSFTAGLVVLGFGYVVYRVLEANLIDGRDIRLERLFARLPDASWSLVVDAAPVMLAVGVGFAAVVAAISFASWALGALFAALARAEPRGLTHEEAAYIVRSEAALKTYAEGRGYSRFASIIFWGALGMTAGFVGLGAHIGLSLHKWFPRPYSAEDLQGIGWHLYHVEPTNALIVITFAAIGWSLLPFAIAYRLSPRFAEMYGWSGFGLKSVEVSAKPYIEHMVRSGRLSIERPFDPAKFLRDLNKTLEGYYFFPAVVLTFAAAMIWHHDVSRYYLMTEHQIEVMDYWTLEKQRTSYSAVEGVVLGCEFDGDDEPAPSYELRLPNDFSLDVLDEATFADLGRIDRRIPDSVERRFPSDYDAHCVEALAAAFDEPERGSIRDILRVEVWHRRRWEQRISRPK